MFYVRLGECQENTTGRTLSKPLKYMGFICNIFNCLNEKKQKVLKFFFSLSIFIFIFSFLFLFFFFYILNMRQLKRGFLFGMHLIDVLIKKKMFSNSLFLSLFIFLYSLAFFFFFFVAINFHPFIQ
jgi:hypothetical protein